MISNTEYDFSNLTEKLSGLTGALLGRGASPGDAQRLLMTETGQLAGRMGDAVGPKTQAAAMKRIDRDIKQFLTILPKYSNLDEDQQYSSTADFTWLTASKSALLGINDEDNRLNANGSEALTIFRTGQKTGSRGNAYQTLGNRGHQKIQRLNRTRVSMAAMNFVRASIRNKTGQLRAAFYRVAIKYVPSKRVPQWIMKNIDAVIANGKSGLTEGGFDTPQAFIEFAVRAPGVTSNGIITSKLSGAVKQSSFSIDAKLKNILQGYKYDWETGRVFRDRTGNDFTDN